MKAKLVGIFLGVLVGSAAYSNSEYHDFMDVQGRSMRGRVLRYEARTNQVTIETDNKRTATVPATVFDQEGQTYIMEWAKAQEFLDEGSFRIKAQRTKTDDDRSSSGGSIQATEVEDHAYEITMENRSQIAIKGLKLEYCIFYEQDEVINHKQATEEGVKCGTLDIADMQPKSEQVLTTDAVKLYKRTLDADWIYTSDIKNVQKGEVDGVWIRMTMVTDTGKTFMRDYCLPDSLNSSHAWTTTSTDVGMNKGSSKKKKKK